MRHGDDLVDWYPWGPEAFGKAEAEDKPLFLSVGYSACHWCHLAEREQFRNEELAEIINREFISVLVDREERPDIEKIYLAAVQLMTGRAGWPLTVFLMPDRRPFYGGTFFPAESQQGTPGFRQALETVIQTFHENRDRVNLSADIISNQVRGVCYPTPSPGPLGQDLLARGAVSLADRFDERFGGLRGIPKFPPSVALAFLFRTLHRTGEPALLLRIQKTLDGMSRGGTYDQIGGGFHRYSTDARWLIPSFEKMLSDNALLIPLYLDAHLIMGNRSYIRVAGETLAYVLRELKSPEGGFFASQDSETEGREGPYYLWREKEILDVLGPEEGRLFCDLFGVTEFGDFEEGLSVLHRSSGMGGLARKANMPRETFFERFDGWRRALLKRRESRPRPPVDDKIVTAWNGLMISALTRGAQVIGDPRYLKTAEQTAGFLLQNLKTSDGTLLRYYRKGPSGRQAFLEDYAGLAAGLLDLYETDFNVRWLEESISLTDWMMDLFWDNAHGGFYHGEEDPKLLARPKEFDDSATPCGNTLAAHVLLRLGVLLDSRTHLEKAFRSLEAAWGLMEKVPAAHPGMLSALDYYLSPTHEIAVAGDPSDANTLALVEKVWAHYLPNRVLALVHPDRPAERTIPLTEGKRTVDGKPAVYLCENYQCSEPITDPDLLARTLYVSDDE